ncbi:MAG: His-Xaa-Ser system radical SAM maturase HxsC [Deltaproteobacteria bacterium]|jgi:His-Xaa-Ser system radical SAM maturase HxsC|nr:His-Xaa-Ser system radical SAM maturase HxsC [Deltaproteobacteria bacterium]
MKTVRGTASGEFGSIVGEITRTGVPFYRRSGRIRLADTLGFDCLGYAGYLTEGMKGGLLHPDGIYAASGTEGVEEGDIVMLTSDGTVTVLWGANSSQNSLFVTKACNCDCLMCPQPPAIHDPQDLVRAEKVLDCLRSRSVKQICITGGEPTVLGARFLKVLERCSREHPEAAVNVLTNGKLFSDPEFAGKTASASNGKALFCVSLHSDIDTVHDRLVGARGSYAAAQAGIYNLAKLGCAVEIRHVISKGNFNRLKRFSEQMYSYFPFCAHYAFMGMEICGQAFKNFDEINVSPLEYRDCLEEAVMSMYRAGLPVSVYNVPLCLCSEKTRPFARQSISSWKNIFMSQCEECSKKDKCAGFFGTSAFLPGDLVRPFREDACDDSSACWG